MLMVGLDAAGKTTILYKLHLGEVVTTIPTVGEDSQCLQCGGDTHTPNVMLIHVCSPPRPPGFNVEKVDYNNISFNVWDIGGQDKVQQQQHCA